MELPISIRPLMDALKTVFVMPAAVILVISRCFLMAVKYLKSKMKIFSLKCNKCKFNPEFGNALSQH